MVRRLDGIAGAIVLGSLMLAAACSHKDLPTAPETTAIVQRDTIDLPSWVASPAVLPAGQVGQNNCTFPFGQDVPQWNFHPDAGCWERPGPDGWTRQQFQKIHIPNFPSCGGGPGDGTAIRVCRAGGAGQASACG